MSSPATPITYTLTNQGTNDIDIRSISYATDSNIQHHADYSNFNYGGADSTANTSADQYVKRYVTGDFKEKRFVSDTHARTVYYSTNTGATLTVQNSIGHTTDGICAGWTAAGVGFTGLHVQQVISPTQLLLSGAPSGIITPGESIVFSTSLVQIVLTETVDLQPSWSIINNGYNAGDHAVIISKLTDDATLNVNVLPTNPTVNNKMLFTSSTNHLTLNNTNNLAVGYTASGTGYDNSQYIVNIIDGQTVEMSAPPNAEPDANSTITFTSNQLLYTLASGTSVTFSINYVNNTSNVGSNYPSALTINAIQNSVPVIGHINNYTNINSPPVPPPSYSNIYNGRGSGFNDGGYTASDPGVQGGWGYGYGEGTTNGSVGGDGDGNGGSASA